MRIPPPYYKQSKLLLQNRYLIWAVPIGDAPRYVKWFGKINDDLHNIVLISFSAFQYVDFATLKYNCLCQDEDKVAWIAKEYINSFVLLLIFLFAQ